MGRSGNGVSAAVICAAALLTALVAGASGGEAAPSTPKRANVIFVLADDLSWNLVNQYMPNVRRLMQDGMTFDDYYVTDSLCCPSRSTIYTGRFPHNTGVFTNGGGDGGWQTFVDRGNVKRMYANAMHRSKAAYGTSMMGKVMNGYPVTPGSTGYPAFWTDWQAANGQGYNQYHYRFNNNGHLGPVRGFEPTDYLTDVLAKKGRAFIQRSAGTANPFALEVAPYSPHAATKSFPAHGIQRGLAKPAPSDDDDAQCALDDFKAPQNAAYDVDHVNPPAWLNRRPLDADEKAKLDLQYCKRVQADISVDALVGALRDELVDQGIAEDTYVVFSSDNGFHLGEHRLLAGKQTAFETDIRVPLIVAGPGVAAGVTRTERVSNIDLAPTFDRIAGAKLPNGVDGHSLLGLMHGDRGSRWRKRILVEHHHAATKAQAGPDDQINRQGDPPTYTALRGSGYIYVKYAKPAGGRADRSEYYRLGNAHVPAERVNVYRSLSKRRKATLRGELARLTACKGHRGKSSCWKAAGGR